MIKRIIYLFLALYIQAHQVKAVTVRVCPSCPVNGISKAIAISSPFDSILIEKGNYAEKQIIIDKPMTLLGNNFPVIDGGNKGEIFTINADSVVIRGLQIQNVGISYTQDQAGIRVNKRKFCRIENNKLLNTYFGIYLLASENCSVTGNEVTGYETRESQTGNAIHLFKSKNIHIENNRLTGHRDGIYFEFVENTKIFNNTSSGQIRYGMHFMFSNDNEYYHNNFTQNGAGVAVMYSKRIYMHENIFSENWSAVSNGILLKDITDSKIEKNIFERNTIGIYAEGCLRISIQNNDFIKNGWAVKILGTSEDNSFVKNNFISNTFEVVTNTSKSHNLFENNFWSDYTGYDLNRDGIGDVPHSPVKLFTYIVENTQPAIILLRSLFIDLLNLAEKVAPVITPETLRDEKPMMARIKIKNI